MNLGGTLVNPVYLQIHHKQHPKHLFHLYSKYLFYLPSPKRKKNVGFFTKETKKAPGKKSSEMWHVDIAQLKNGHLSSRDHNKANYLHIAKLHLASYGHILK